MDPPHTAPPAMPLTKRGTRTTMGCSPQNIHLAHIFEFSITYGLAHCQTLKFLRLPQRVLHWSCAQKQPFALQQCCRNRATRTNLSRLEPPILRTANPGTFQPYTPIKLTLEPCKLGNFSNVLPIQARAVQPTHRNSQPKEVSSEQDVCQEYQWIHANLTFVLIFEKPLVHWFPIFISVYWPLIFVGLRKNPIGYDYVYHTHQ